MKPITARMLSNLCVVVNMTSGSILFVTDVLISYITTSRLRDVWMCQLLDVFYLADFVDIVKHSS